MDPIDSALAKPLPMRADNTPLPVPPAETADERWYRKEISRQLRTIARKLHARGMSFVAVAETSPGKREVTRSITERVSVGMAVTNIAIDSGANIDGFAMNVRGLVLTQGIAHQSALLKAMGVEPDPANRGPKAEEPAIDPELTARLTAHETEADEEHNPEGDEIDVTTNPDFLDPEPSDDDETAAERFG